MSKGRQVPRDDLVDGYDGSAFGRYLEFVEVAIEVIGGAEFVNFIVGGVEL